ncbi:L-serine ammonia-lyase, iron-sulfur-dependent subunit beta [Clostridiaceae bacterium M8S5]|nr:L-serine ammonia-lyase, iron-sulfur-dependent subunit beta [Clostridiaceae bacterium M8S5]
MNDYSVFDILGPIMVGPSSSHTAGAARLGMIARCIVGDNFDNVDFYLYGSFAKTYKGHGTDKALTAGILGMNPSDTNLKDSLKIAKERGIRVYFIKRDDEVDHPNTVKIVVHSKDGSTTEIVGESIGGGNINIKKIDGYVVELTGKLPTLIIRHIDKKGMISKVSTELAKDGVNIATMKVSRTKKGNQASMILEVDEKIDDIIVKHLNQIEDITSVRYINL